MMLKEYRCKAHNWRRVPAFEMDVDLTAQMNLTDLLFDGAKQKVDTTL
jgi:hypothetical protein